MLGLFFGLVRYTEMSDNAMDQVQRYYKYFIDVQIMIFVGFGFLMTFMRRYSLGAVSLNYLASALMMLEAVLVIGATQQGFWNQKSSKIQIDIALLIDCSFCAGSGMIAFGAIIGKATPTQLLWLLVWQVPLYALNQHLVIHTFKALDMGGTIVIHLFGAYYGLAASLMLSWRQPLHGLDHPKNASSYLNDVFSMVGTLFLWIYWPSFNGALASVAPESLATATDAQKMSQFLCIVNTLLSLLGAVLSTFATSALVTGRLSMVHVQNSTLAGGVAMGAACTLRLTPGGALCVGLFAGCVSTLGFSYLTPFLDRTIGLGDTCGVHNLHGIPAIIGTLVAGLASLGQHSDYLMYGTGREQLGWEVLAGGVTLGIAVSGGLLGAWVVTALNLTRSEPMDVSELFDDGPWWEGQRVEPLPVSSSVYLMGASTRRDGSVHPRASVDFSKAGGSHYSHRRAEVALALTAAGLPADPSNAGGMPVATAFAAASGSVHGVALYYHRSSASGALTTLPAPAAAHLDAPPLPASQQQEA
ncbi:hypothetical protein HYH03_011678 [Edaphochlamys debaryana]|uniref:Ammonium transporter AmtB-like domain-containing protein n=1 Tax=Edaphochlamys debaryana TaxID=47281 RepID=A0A835XWY0_9CHLO|nr:hypothetical protein HYH03_011678 [Edaphochlamys debaryana]|eukprot:KAG2489876.1 hypothetical protein HYH03_011678 [Edaphochlamys debaryana]